MRDNIKKYFRRLVMKDISKLKRDKNKLQEENPTNKIKIEDCCINIKISYESLDYINNCK